MGLDDPVFKDVFNVEKELTVVIKEYCDSIGSPGPNSDGSCSAFYPGVRRKDFFVFKLSGRYFVDNGVRVIFTETLFFRLYPIFEFYPYDVDHYGFIEKGLGLFGFFTLEVIIDVLSLGVLFTLFQIIEYMEAYFSIIDGVYGRTFFIATGFHGFHVLVGTLFL